MNKIFHLNCGTMLPGIFNKRFRFVLHCLLIDTGEGLVLVDTGWGIKDYENPSSVVRWVMNMVSSPKQIEEAAVNQIQALGYRPEDVKHILMTHMHVDHTGGLSDFPQAKVHIYQGEYDAIMSPRSFVERLFYIQAHWGHQTDWVMHKLEGDDFYGFEATPLTKLGDYSFQFVPLVGHSRGHCAVLLMDDSNRCLMHCGDAYVASEMVDINKPLELPKGILGKIVEKNPLFNSVSTHVPRLRELRQELGENLLMVCSHDASHFDQLADL